MLLLIHLRTLPTAHTWKEPREVKAPPLSTARISRTFAQHRVWTVPPQGLCGREFRNCQHVVVFSAKLQRTAWPHRSYFNGHESITSAPRTPMWDPLNPIFNRPINSPDRAKEQLCIILFSLSGRFVPRYREIPYPLTYLGPINSPIE